MDQLPLPGSVQLAADDRSAPRMPVHHLPLSRFSIACYLSLQSHTDLCPLSQPVAELEN